MSIAQHFSSLLGLKKTTITMGTGDVITGLAIDPEHGSGAFIFKQADQTCPLGTKADWIEGLVTVADADVAIVFSDAEAVDRMIDSLVHLRDVMKAQP